MRIGKVDTWFRKTPSHKGKVDTQGNYEHFSRGGRKILVEAPVHNFCRHSPAKRDGRTESPVSRWSLGYDPSRQFGSHGGATVPGALAFPPVCPGISNSPFSILRVSQETSAHPEVVSHSTFCLLKL